MAACWRPARPAWCATRPCCWTPAPSIPRGSACRVCRQDPLRVVDLGFSANGSALAATIQRLERQGGYWSTVATELLVWKLADAGTASLAMRVKLPWPEGVYFRLSRLALSPDGRTAYASLPLSAYDVDSGRLLYSRKRLVGSFGIRNTASNFFELDPTGTLLAVPEAPDRLLLLDAASGRIRHVLRGHDDRVRSLVFSHDGQVAGVLVVGSDRHHLGRGDGRRPRAAAARRGGGRHRVRPR